MARSVIDDTLWAIIEPVLPKPKARRKRYPGRKPVEARRCLTGILFVLRTGIPWEDLPAEMGCSGMTCWRRLRDWNRSGVWNRLHETLLAKLNEAEKLDWRRAVLLSADRDHDIAPRVRSVSRRAICSMRRSSLLSCL
jgi:transposase